jgi:hypothetical protein
MHGGGLGEILCGAFLELFFCGLEHLIETLLPQKPLSRALKGWLVFFNLVFLFTPWILFLVFSFTGFVYPVLGILSLALEILWLFFFIATLALRGHVSDYYGKDAQALKR